MATRHKLPTSGTPPSTPSAGSMWERQIAGFTRWPTFTANQGSTLTDYAALFGSTSSSQTLWHQWISQPLDRDQTISGTISIVVRGLEAAAADDLHLAYTARVLVGNTSTERGVLIAQGATATEYTTSAETRIFSAQSVTTVNALRGDRIVFEVGFHGLTPQSGATGTLRFGDPIGTADFALTSGLTTDLVPWIELSATITYGDAIFPTGEGSGTTEAALVGVGVLDCRAEGLSSHQCELVNGAPQGDLQPRGDGSSAEECALLGVGVLQAQAEGSSADQAAAVGLAAADARAEGSSTEEAALLGVGVLEARAEGSSADQASAIDGNLPGALECRGEGSSTEEAAALGVGVLEARGEGSSAEECSLVDGAPPPGSTEARAEGLSSASCQLIGVALLELHAEGWSDVAIVEDLGPVQHRQRTRRTLTFGQVDGVGSQAARGALAQVDP